MRKKTGQSQPAKATLAPRALAPSVAVPSIAVPSVAVPRVAVPSVAAASAAVPSHAPRSARYPDMASIAREASSSALVRGALALGALTVLAATSGCREPVCQASRLGELSVHAQSAVGDAASLRMGDAAQQLGVSVGIVPHPAMALPGAMIPVSPSPALPAPAPLPTP
jgi:hypothetical protein